MLTPFFSKLEPSDVVAVITLTGAFFLLRSGIDGIVSGIAVAIITYYFVRKAPRDKPKT